MANGGMAKSMELAILSAGMGINIVANGRMGLCMVKGD